MNEPKRVNMYKGCRSLPVLIITVIFNKNEIKQVVILHLVVTHHKAKKVKDDVVCFLNLVPNRIFYQIWCLSEQNIIDFCSTFWNSNYDSAAKTVRLKKMLEKNYNYEVVTLCWFVLAELNMLLEGYKYFFVLKNSVWNIKSNYIL